MKTVMPSEKSVDELVNGEVDDKPIVMVNLLKYRGEADYSHLDASHRDYGKKLTGEEAYSEYGKVVIKLVWSVGGQILWSGRPRLSLISPDEESWDSIALVQYPSRKAFIEMVASDEYQTAVHHRTAALEDSRLIETQAVKLPKLILMALRAFVRLKSLFKFNKQEINYLNLKNL